MGRGWRSIRAVPRTCAVMFGGVPARIGQANEPMSPSPPATGGTRSTVPPPRRAAAGRIGLRGRSVQYRGRTGLCMGWTGLWSGGESSLVAHASTKRGFPLVPISAEAFTCMLMSSGFSRAELPSSTGYVRGSVRHAAWLRSASLTGGTGGPSASESVAGGRVRRRFPQATSGSNPMTAGGALIPSAVSWSIGRVNGTARSRPPPKVSPPLW